MASRVTVKYNIEPIIRNAKTLPEAVMEGLLERLQQISPVDTGDFRAGWRSELTDPTTGIVYNVDIPVEKLLALENGWSDQAPNGVLNVALAEVKYLIIQHTRKVA